MECFDIKSVYVHILFSGYTHIHTLQLSLLLVHHYLRYSIFFFFQNSVFRYPSPPFLHTLRLYRLHSIQGLDAGSYGSHIIYTLFLFRTLILIDCFISYTRRVYACRLFFYIFCLEKKNVLIYYL